MTSVVVMAIDQKFAGYVTIANEIKADAKQAITDLHALNIKTMMLSGDKQSVVNKDGSITYHPDEQGNTIPDFSHRN